MKETLFSKKNLPIVKSTLLIEIIGISQGPAPGVMGCLSGGFMVWSMQRHISSFMEETMWKAPSPKLP